MGERGNGRRGGRENCGWDVICERKSFKKYMKSELDISDMV